MRRIKIMLVLLFIVTSAIYGFTSIQYKLSGVDIGPTIESSQETVQVSVEADESELLAGLTASDKQDGDLTDQIIIGEISKLISENTAKVTYLVFDSDDNMASLTRYVHYTDYRRPRLGLSGPLNFSNDATQTILDNIWAMDVIDGNISDKIRISMLRSTDHTEIFSISVQVTNSMGDTTTAELPVIITESDPMRPVISLSSYLVNMSRGESFDPNDYLRYVTINGETHSRSGISIEHSVDTNTPGTYWVTYSYTYGDVTGMSILTVVVQ